MSTPLTAEKRRYGIFTTCPTIVVGGAGVLFASAHLMTAGADAIKGEYLDAGFGFVESLIIAAFSAAVLKSAIDAYDAK